MEPPALGRGSCSSRAVVLRGLKRASCGHPHWHSWEALMMRSAGGRAVWQQQALWKCAPSHTPWAVVTKEPKMSLPSYLGIWIPVPNWGLGTKPCSGNCLSPWKKLPWGRQTNRWEHSVSTRPCQSGSQAVDLRPSSRVKTALTGSVSDDCSGISEARGTGRAGQGWGRMAPFHPVFGPDLREAVTSVQA